jgi:DNA polymerase V
MPVFGLIDGNSFYCAAERAFAPELRGVPLVVLSNNDGCAIARTAEAKAMGIKMGEPWHLAQRRSECKAVEWRSSNYPLYGDMSRRMYEVLAARVLQVEPYSIDEIFLDLTGLPDLERFCHSLRDDVRRIAKIPTCIGIGPTKPSPSSPTASPRMMCPFAVCAIYAMRHTASPATRASRSAWSGASAAKPSKS